MPKRESSEGVIERVIIASNPAANSRAILEHVTNKRKEIGLPLWTSSRKIMSARRYPNVFGRPCVLMNVQVRRPPANGQSVWQAAGIDGRGGWSG